MPKLLIKYKIENHQSNNQDRKLLKWNKFMLLLKKYIQRLWLLILTLQKLNRWFFKKICLYEYDNQMKLITILKNWKKNHQPNIHISLFLHEKKKKPHIQVRLL